MLVGTVIGPRPADADSPEEEKLYRVEISDKRFYRTTDLEAVPPPPLQRFSKEWNAELERWIEAGKRLLANPHDSAALAQFSESGGRSGFVVPITPEKK